jgi:hypothetical protein
VELTIRIFNCKKELDRFWLGDLSAPVRKETNNIKKMNLLFLVYYYGGESDCEMMILVDDDVMR